MPDGESEAEHTVSACIFFKSLMLAVMKSLPSIKDAQSCPFNKRGGS